MHQRPRYTRWRGLPLLNPEIDPMSQRRFPPPWTVEDIGAAFVVRDHNGQALKVAQQVHC